MRPDGHRPGLSDRAAPTEADLLAESGRGLRTVSLLARSWGWHGNTYGGTVTAVFATDPTGVVPLLGARPENDYPDDKCELAGATYAL